MRLPFRTGLLAFAFAFSLPAYGGIFDLFNFNPQPSGPIEVSPENITIKSASFIGEGCSGAAALLSPDNLNLSIFYPSFFVAHSGSSPDAGYEYDSANCRARIRMDVPPGYQFALVSGTGRGQAVIDANAQGEFNVKYGFNIFSLLTGRSSLKIPGPYANNYEHSFEMPVRATSWSSCDSYQRDLVVDAEAKVRTRGNASALMTVDSSEYAVDHEYGLVWRQCQDRTLAVVAVCRAVYDSSGNLAETQGHAIARTQAEAIAKAQSRALERCENRSGGALCSAPVNPCQIQSL